MRAVSLSVTFAVAVAFAFTVTVSVTFTVTVKSSVTFSILQTASFDTHVGDPNAAIIVRRIILVLEKERLIHTILKDKNNRLVILALIQI